MEFSPNVIIFSARTTKLGVQDINERELKTQQQMSAIVRISQGAYK